MHKIIRCQWLLRPFDIFINDMEYLTWSASLLMVQNWREWLIDQMSLERPTQAGEMVWQEAYEAQPRKMPCPAPGRNNSIHQHRLGLKAAWQRRTCECWLVPISQTSVWLWTVTCLWPLLHCQQVEEVIRLFYAAQKGCVWSAERCFGLSIMSCGYAGASLP